MSNAYGTEKYYKLREDYCKGFKFVLSEIKDIEFDNIKIEIKRYEANKDNYYRTKSDIILSDNLNNKLFISSVNFDAYPSSFLINGKQYIFLRCDLYGYTFIDVDNFDEINYFPSDIFEGKEAFIISQVTAFKNLLILEGSYWAEPDEIFVMDFSMRKVVRLIYYCGPISLKPNSISIVDNVLSFDCEESDETYYFTYEELIDLIDEDGVFDL